MGTPTPSTKNISEQGSSMVPLGLFTCGLQHSAEAWVRGCSAGVARFVSSVHSPPGRPSAVLLPPGGVSDPVLAVEMVAWVSSAGFG